MALGAFFSAAEVIPLTLLTVEAWTFLQLGTRQQVGGVGSFPHRWAVLFLVSVGFWNFLGAGVFGFLINLPVVSYYEIGTLLTSNHGHAAFMGVYGMLALALLAFCTRYLARPGGLERAAWCGYAFWSTNVGLMLMILGHLFPLGVLQLGDVVTNGYWHARSEWFRNYPWLSWARLPGDVIFMSGSFLLAWQALKVALHPRRSPAPATRRGMSPEAPLFTVVDTGRHPGSGLNRIASRDDAGGPTAMPPLAGWARTIDLPLVLLLGLPARPLGRWLGAGGRGACPLPQGEPTRPRGFGYDEVLDRYECPQGELLTLQTFDDRDKLAIYKAPASSCNACVLKAFCTPHDEGRHVYRSLAEFHETDVGLVPPPALADHPGHLGALRPRRV